METVRSMYEIEGRRFEPFRIEHLIDPSGNYRLDLDPDFPMKVQLLSYPAQTGGYPLNWHERLELFLPVKGRGVFRMGDSIIPFSAGDLIVVDTRKYHGLEEFRGDDPAAIVISFLPSLVYGPASPQCDLHFLGIFYSQDDKVLPILRRTDSEAHAVRRALNHLLDSYFGSASLMHFQTGCKAHLLQALHLLNMHFRLSDSWLAEYMRRKQHVGRMARLHSYVETHYAEKISIGQAAEIMAMSETRFMKAFKKATGMTFVAYLTHVRVMQAARLLRDPDLSIADIAVRVGFSDQSYFDKKFKLEFQRTPREYRLGLHSPAFGAAS